jgi:DNA primase
LISKATIDRILDAARIEEVIGEFVSLKKRGANYTGLSPFQNEKTPSFTVSPAKGIFKDFSSGKAGNVVSFLMEQEKLSYPDALRWLAKKYNVEIEETEQTAEEKQALSLRESIFLANAFAQKFFTDTLHDTDEGKSVGLSYFKERGLTTETIKKFQLGYAIDSWQHFTNEALAAGYNPDILVKAGLIGKKDNRPDGEADSYFDFFKARVLFPVHNVSGRVAGFSGRTLSNDKNIAKYKNSPDTEVYHKSSILFGLYFAKKAIVAANNCYLVEGNLDLIALHQAGIENTVAPLGTALTIEQVRLLRKYTTSITILFDGDKAGIKASLRAIDMVLEEGLNVKVLLLPEGEDPDSYSRKVSAAELKEYLEKQAQDFISFKASLLFEESKNDPIKKAALIRDIVESIALIPDAISRSVYVRECARIMEMDEQLLINELNRFRRQKLQKSVSKVEAETIQDLRTEDTYAIQPVLTDDSQQEHEKEVARLLLNYGDQLISLKSQEESGEEIEMPIAQFIVHELTFDDIQIEYPIYAEIFNTYKSSLEQQQIPHLNFFIHHPEQYIQQAAIDLVNSQYQLSPHWGEKHKVYVTTEDMLIKQSVVHTIQSIRVKKVQRLIDENRNLLKNYKETEERDTFDILERIKILTEAKNQIAAGDLGRVVLQ